MLTTMFDIRYYKKYLDTCNFCMQVLAHFITPPPYFDRVSIISVIEFFLDNDMQPLLSVCFHM